MRVKRKVHKANHCLPVLSRMKRCRALFVHRLAVDRCFSTFDSLGSVFGAEPNVHSFNSMMRVLGGMRQQVGGWTHVLDSSMLYTGRTWTFLSWNDFDFFFLFSFSEKLTACIASVSLSSSNAISLRCCCNCRCLLADVCLDP